MAEAARARYLDLQGVADYVAISRTTVNVLVERGVLPKPIALSARIKRWDREAIDAALAGKPESAQGGSSISDISREIADDIAAEGRLSAAQKARRRARGRLLPLARNGQEDRG